MNSPVEGEGDTPRAQPSIPPAYAIPPAYGAGDPGPSLPPPPPNKKDDGFFTSMFNSPSHPGALSPQSGKPNVPQPGTAPVGEFTRMFGSTIEVPKRIVTVRVFYATDRNTGQFTRVGDFYLNDRDPQRTLKLGLCEVTIPGGDRHKIGRLESPSIWRFEFREDPTKHIVLAGIRPQSRDDFYNAVQKRVSESAGKEALVFVHGYNASFEDAARRTAQLAYDLQFEGAPILYSWPSRADPKAYTVDETNVTWTVPQLHTFLCELSKTSGATTLHLIAHSMGNRALVAALHDLALEAKASNSTIRLPLFHHVVLTAPDIDADTFRDLALVFKSTADRVTMYSCSSDVALAASRTFHGYRRAGDSIPMVPGIDIIDATAVDTSLLHHSYFAGNRSVVSDIFSLLKDGKPPASRFGMSPVATAEGTYYVFRP